MSDKINPKDVEAPTHLDGTSIDKDEAARVHALLASGEMKIELADGVAEEMAEAGISVDDLKKLLMASTKKTMS